MMTNTKIVYSCMYWDRTAVVVVALLDFLSGRSPSFGWISSGRDQLPRRTFPSWFTTSETAQRVAVRGVVDLNRILYFVSGQGLKQLGVVIDAHRRVIYGSPNNRLWHLFLRVFVVITS